MPRDSRGRDIRGPTCMATMADQIGDDVAFACEDNNVAQIMLLTSAETTSKFWTTVLAAAAFAGAVDVAAYCIKKGAQVNDQVYEYIFVSKKSEPVFRYLYECVAIERIDRYVEWWGSMLGVAASSKSRHSIARYCLENGANPNFPVGCQGNMPTITAAAWLSDAEMVAMLLDYGAQLENTGAMIRAAEKGKVENVRVLLSRGGDVNEIRLSARNGFYGPPMNKAVENGHVGESLDVLLDAGADVMLKDAEGKTAADFARERGMGRGVIARLSPVN